MAHSDPILKICEYPLSIDYPTIHSTSIETNSETFTSCGTFGDVFIKHIPPNRQGLENEEEPRVKAVLYNTDARFSVPMHIMGIVSLHEPLVHHFCSSHENIAKILACYIEYRGSEPMCYQVMPLYPTDAFELLRQTYEYQDALRALHVPRFAKQLLSALKFMHENGIYHRDVKLENIFMTTNDITTADIKLGDFGFSTTICKENTPRQYMGTMEYLPPEYFLTDLTRKNFLYSADMYDSWAFGMTIMFMHTLTPAWRYAKADDLVYRMWTQYRWLAPTHNDSTHIISMIPRTLYDTLSNNLLVHVKMRSSLINLSYDCIA
jgi:serine/threonine protein kinase